MNTEDKVTFGKVSLEEGQVEGFDKTADSQLTDNIKELGKITVLNPKGNIHCLTIIGQIEGHVILPPQNKTTKYEQHNTSVGCNRRKRK
jgi:hypothetical protein